MHASMLTICVAKALFCNPKRALRRQFALYIRLSVNIYLYPQAMRHYTLKYLTCEVQKQQISAKSILTIQLSILYLRLLETSQSSVHKYRSGRTFAAMYVAMNYAMF